jgi:hypothetical protein
MMVRRGHVENGVILLDNSPPLPEGAQVEVRLIESPRSQHDESGMPSLYERLEEFVGKAEGLPPDASVNLDHYLYGLPKRQ